VQVSHQPARLPIEAVIIFRDPGEIRPRTRPRSRLISLTMPKQSSAGASALLPLDRTVFIRIEHGDFLLEVTEAREVRQRVA
jgi:hypothetical protein